MKYLYSILLLLLLVFLVKQIFVFKNGVLVEYQIVTGPEFKVKNKEKFKNYIVRKSNCKNFSEFYITNDFDNLTMMRGGDFIVNGNTIDCTDEGISIVKIDYILSVKKYYFMLFLTLFFIVIFSFLLFYDSARLTLTE